MDNVKCVLVTTVYNKFQFPDNHLYELCTWDPEHIMVVGVNDKRHFKETVELVSNHKPVFSPLLLCNPYELSMLKHAISRANILIKHKDDKKNSQNR